MKKFYTAFTLIFILIAIAVKATAADYLKIDEHARNTPEKFATKVESLAAYLVKPAKNDTEKIRSFYVWIAENVSYDVQSYLKGGFSNIEPIDVMQKKRAVCQGYSGLFQALCAAQGIRCEMVPGYSKGFGFSTNNGFTQSDHVWNAVQLDNKWMLVDVTWGSGGVNSSKKFVKEFKEDYFLSNPKEFVKSHLPQDPLWQLLNCPVSLKAFAQGDEAIAKELSNCKSQVDYNDRIAIHHELAKEERNLQTAKNAYAFNPDNKTVMAQGYINYAYAIIKNVKQELRSKEEIMEVIGLQEQSLKYLYQASDLLKNVKGGQGEAMKRLVEQNIKNAEQNMKAMKEVVKS